MNDVLPAGWGMLVGELFGLEELSNICEEQSRASKDARGGL